MKLRFIEDLAELPAAHWDALAGAQPCLRHAYLHALQASGCASPATGWRACFATAWEDGRLVGGLPLYFKNHSWGEFVFDWAWAEAYQRHGLAYYPKLISAVPFTPVTGPRLLADRPEVCDALLDAALGLAQDSGVSSLHLLFPAQVQAETMAARGLMIRQGMQLHWRNPGYRDFADYLASLRRDKRKKIQQERRRVTEAGIHFESLTGTDISEAHWRHFVRCYDRTHDQFHSPKALNLDFFLRLGETLPDQQLLVIGYRDRTPIAAAWCLKGGGALYGRSWGTLEYHDGLHFETCYYQPIEYCIEHGLGLFEGGAQGEHKLARGFLPETTWSAHWLAEPRFADAVAGFLRRETGGLAGYVDTLIERSPFKSV